MPKIAFRPKLHLNKKNLKQLEVVNGIVEEYFAMGYRLTLRQLYYQLVSRDIIANQVKEYDKLSALLVKGRMAGVVDWDAIEDRIRVPDLPYFVDGVEQAITNAGNHYRIDRQLGQKNYMELWVEKDALSSVLRRKSYHYHINLMVNRGYSSCTAMYDAYNRFLAAHENGKTLHILYCGDHDPSGLDMIRDINDRLIEFGTTVKVHPIALTMEQIKQYDPPPNPAKVTDPRAKWYIGNFGKVSWEVDALRPEVLHDIIDTNIERLLDMKKFKAILSKEEGERAEMKALPKQKEGMEHLRGFLQDKILNIDEKNLKGQKKTEYNIYNEVFSELRKYE